MTPAIPVIDVRAAEAGDRAQLEAVRTATEEFGAVQVVNHGVPQDLVADLNARAGRLLGLPRAEKAKLASPHPYRGWRQWPDDFGRLELERFNVAQFDDIERPGGGRGRGATWACSRTPTCGRPTTRGCGTRPWRTSRRPAAWRSGCSGCTPRRRGCPRTRSASVPCRTCG